ncbi:MAG TPA: hypothetical protein VF384_12105 [Planctomycetota bacterium]
MATPGSTVADDEQQAISEVFETGIKIVDRTDGLSGAERNPCNR